MFAGGTSMLPAAFVFWKRRFIWWTSLSLCPSSRLGHSAYDVFYFVLARRNAATLCTLDQRLQQLCLKNGVNCFYGLDVEGERWTVRFETEVGPGGERGYTREELERAVCRDANGE